MASVRCRGFQLAQISAPGSRMVGVSSFRLRSVNVCAELRGDAGTNDPVFATRKGGARLKQRAIGYMLKRTAKRAGITQPVSPHWPRHAHGSHALDRGAAPRISLGVSKRPAGPRGAPPALRPGGDDCSD